MMKTTFPSTFVAVAVLLATPALAQESSRADFEEYCDAWKGRWVGDVVWVADWPGFGKKGDKVKCYLEFTVIEDGNALISKFFGGSGSGTAITVYNAAAKRIEETVVTSGGTIFSHVIYKDDDGNWVGITKGSTPDGSKIKGKSLMKISDNGNKHSFSGSTTIGGKPVDDLQDVWVRVSDN